MVRRSTQGFLTRTETPTNLQKQILTDGINERSMRSSNPCSQIALWSRRRPSDPFLLTRPNSTGEAGRAIEKAPPCGTLAQLVLVKWVCGGAAVDR